MKKNKTIFLMLGAFLCLGAAFGTAQAQDLTFPPDGSNASAAQPAEDNGLSIPPSPYGSAHSSSESDGPKLGAKYTPQWTKDFTVAADYYKLIGKLPDFVSWATNSDRYKKLGGNPFTQKQVLENLVAEYTALFNNVDVSDDLIIRMRVHISKYSEINQGFIVTRGFDNRVYFRYNYGGQSFAVIPQNLGSEANKWLAVPPRIAKDLARDAAANEYNMNVALFIKPSYADAKAGPSTLDDDNDYYLISGTISNIMVFDRSGTKVLWEKNTKQYTDKQQQDLLNLKQ